MADIVPHISGEKDSELHWWHRWVEVSAEIARLKEALYFDARIAEAAEAYALPADGSPAGRGEFLAPLREAIAAKRNHLTASKTAEATKPATNGRGTVPK